MQMSCPKKSITKNMLMYGFVFLFIFQPPALFPLSSSHLLAGLSIMLLLTRYRQEFFALIKRRELMIFISLQLAIVAYTCISDLLSASASVDNPYYRQFATAIMSVSFVIEIVPCALFIAIFFWKRKLDTTRFFHVFLTVGMLQVFCAVITFMFPDVREWIVANSGEQVISDVFDIVSSFRMYGLARYYTFSMPLFQGLCVIIAYILGSFTSSKYFLLIPFFLFSIAINARIALVSVIIPPAVILLMRCKNQLLKQVTCIAFMLLVVVSVIQVIHIQAQNSPTMNTWSWLDQGFNEISEFQEGEATGGLASLTKTMYFMPEGIDVLLGTGDYPFGRDYKSSDIGFVINLYYGGLVLSVLLYVSHTLLIHQCFGKSTIERTLFGCLLIYLFFSNLKGNIFTPNELTFAVMTICMFLMIRNRQSDRQAGVCALP